VGLENVPTRRSFSPVAAACAESSAGAPVAGGSVTAIGPDSSSDPLQDASAGRVRSTAARAREVTAAGCQSP
jgi:hypothetical protein